MKTNRGARPYKTCETSRSGKYVGGRPTGWSEPLPWGRTHLATTGPQQAEDASPTLPPSVVARALQACMKETIGVPSTTMQSVMQRGCRLCPIREITEPLQ